MDFLSRALYSWASMKSFFIALRLIFIAVLKLRVVLLIAVSFPGLIRFSVAQDLSEQKSRNQGQFYFSWGYNRDWYSKSDIHVYGHDPRSNTNYDFTLYNAKASDKPDMWRWWYIDRLTIPQYDLTAGYFFKGKHNLGIEIGWNHLKYVVTPNQMVHIKGQILGNQYDQNMQLYDTLLHLQHTNGNNYLLLNLVKRESLLQREKIQVDAIAKVGLGPMISYTIDTILGDRDPGYFHYHGMVFATSLGVRATFFNHIFVQTDMQAALADYTNTKLGHEHLGKSTQYFYSWQWTYELGYTFPVGKK